MQSHEITIGNEKFTLKSDGSPLHVEKLVAEIQKRYDVVTNNKPPRSAQSPQAFKSMAIVALMLLDELQELKNSYEISTGKSIDFARHISDRIDTILSNGFE